MSFEDRIEGWNGAGHDGWSDGWGRHDHGHRGHWGGW
jgi:hypothetical protein